MNFIDGTAKMTPSQIIAWINLRISFFPEKSLGNEIVNEIAFLIEPIIKTNKSNAIDALNRLLDINQATLSDNSNELKMWISLEIASKYKIKELLGNIDKLINSITNNEKLPSYYLKQIYDIRKRISEE